MHIKQCVMYVLLTPQKYVLLYCLIFTLIRYYKGCVNQKEEPVSSVDSTPISPPICERLLYYFYRQFASGGNPWAYGGISC